MPTIYGDISPRTAGYAVKKLLKRAVPHLVLEKFGQTYVLPNNSTKVAKFRRYNSLSATPNALTEGVKPAGKTLTSTDVTATLTQYGDYVEITDVIMDTHEDPVLNETVDILGEQAAEMIEIARFNILKAGTNVIYANGTARTAVNTVFTKPLMRKAVRALKRQNARKVTSVVRSTPNFNTENVAPAYIAFIHPDVENDVRDLVGFVPVENYGSMTPFESEIGKCEDVRFVTSTVFAPWADAGGLAATNNTLSTTGTNSDVYPVLIVGRDAYGIVPLKGKNAITPLISNPRPQSSDPLAQIGTAGWKSMQTAAILNDLWMVRVEVAASA
ncbi:MAG: N4-gp56 family major capsid protein [Gammaproteobacteria bacterium]|nr:MAG: N4-gp56 family major capsid protein [Gammaproteobacteria bacterium]